MVFAHERRRRDDGNRIGRGRGERLGNRSGGVTEERRRGQRARCEIGDARVDVVIDQGQTRIAATQGVFNLESMALATEEQERVAAMKLELAGLPAEQRKKDESRKDKKSELEESEPGSAPAR